MATKTHPATPPHLSLRAARKLAGLNIEQLAEKVAAVLGLDAPLNRGTISAIETGKKGASQQMLDAIAVALGLEAGDLTTDYDPRASKVYREAS